MSTKNQKSEAYTKLNALTTGALKTKAKKATGEELETINAILAERSGDAPKAETPKTEAKKETAQDPELVAELAELEEKLETLKAAKKTNEVKKVEKRIADIKEEMEAKPSAKAEKPKKEPKAPKIKKEKKTAETAVTSSKDKAVQARIDNLVNLVGKDLEAELMDLKMEGIDVEFIVFLSKGDEVSFAAANNSPLKGQTLTGKVVGVSDLDASGRKYCRVRVEGQKASFQKAMMAVSRISLPVAEEPKAEKTPKADAKKDAPKADSKAPKADAKADKAASKK